MYSKQSPHILPVQKDEEIYICQCGKTANAPLCDGSHKQLEGRVKPFVYTADKDDELYICGCGKSKNLPWCDGSHKK
jgi:CDGSH-type Zn-finger protein